MTILFWGKNPKQLEPAPCTLVLAMIVTTTVRIAIEVAINDFDGNDGGEDDYDDCDQGADHNDGAVAGADRKLKPAVANDFCFSVQFCKQPALELPQNRWPVWQTPQRHCGQFAPGW